MGSTLEVTVAVLLGALAIYLVWNFPWLTGYWRPVIVDIDVNPGVVAVVSDVHLGANLGPVHRIGAVLRGLGVDYLVVLGDLFDDEYRVVNGSELYRLLRWAASSLALNPGTTVVYTISLSSHDPQLPVDKPVRVDVDGVTFIVVPGIARLRMGGCTVYVSHGDYASRNGAIAFAINLLACAIGQCGVVERLMRWVLGVGDDEWVAIGHTHLPYIDPRLKVANPGSWFNQIPMKPPMNVMVMRCEGPSLKVDIVKAEG